MDSARTIALPSMICLTLVFFIYYRYYSKKSKKLPDKSQNKVNENVVDNRLEEIKDKARSIINSMLGKGQLNKDVILDLVFSGEPFINFPNMKDELKDELYAS